MYIGDRAMLLTKRGVFQAIGYTHPPGQVIAFLKYVPNGSWRGYKRLTKKYEVTEFLKYTKTVYDPAFGAEIPIVSISEVLLSPEPWRRSEEIISKPRDELEELFVELYSMIDAPVGVLGSMLLGIHNPSFSDIDIAIIEPKDPFQVWFNIESNDSLRPAVEELREVATKYSLEPSLLSSKARRGIFKNKFYSVTFIKKGLERYGKIYHKIGIYEDEVEIHCDERTFYFPHSCELANGMRLEVYETALLPLLIKFNDKGFYVRGLLYEAGGEPTVIIGFREMRGLLHPRKALL